MGKKSPPPAPDYTAAAEKQAASSEKVTNQQTYANRPNITTPFGSQSWTNSQMTDPATGQPVTQWNMNLQLDPQMQAALDSQQRVDLGRSQGAEGLLGQATDAFKNPMDWNALPGRGSIGDPNTFRQQGTDAIDQLNAPILAQRRAAMETRLSNQGIQAGSEAGTNAMRDVNDAESRAHLMAIGEGRAEAAQMFGQQKDRANFDNQNRQQSIGEEMTQRNQPLNELNALLSGQQVAQPNMPTFNTSSASQPTNYSGAANSQYQSALDGYNAKQGAKTGLMNGLFGLGSAAMGAGGWGGLFSMGG